jgi:hypothetical protein
MFEMPTIPTATDVVMGGTCVRASCFKSFFYLTSPVVLLRSLLNRFERP